MRHQQVGPGDDHVLKGPTERSEEVKDTLSRALGFAFGQVQAETGYVNGPRALLAWAEALGSAVLDERSYLGNSYVGMCTLEAKGFASAFLGRLAKSTRHPESRRHLRPMLAYASKCKSSPRSSPSPHLVTWPPKAERRTMPC